MLTGKAGMAQEAGSAQSACSDTGLDDQMAAGSIMSAMLDAEGNKSVAVPASGGIGAVMSTGGPHSDARRLQQDVAAMESWTRSTGADGSLLEESDVQAEDQDIDDSEEDEDGAVLPVDGKLDGPLPPAAFADNTPTKYRPGNKRHRAAHSDVWNVIKRIVDPFHRGQRRAGVEDDPHHTMWTHVCTSCWTLLRLGWNKNRGMWTTSNATKHLRTSSSCLPRAAAKSIAARDNRDNRRITDMLLSGGHSGGGSGSAKTWNLDPASKALTKTVRFYIYGPGLVSQSTFEDEYFREMLQAYYEAAGGVPSWP